MIRRGHRGEPQVMTDDKHLAHDRAGSGEPLVLVHPLGGARFVWEPVMPLLTPERDVIAVDLPGFGDSAPLPEGEHASAARLADAVARQLDRLGLEAAHIAGISLGGWVALEFERIGRALSVTAIAPAGLWSRPLGPRPGPDTRALGRRLRPLVGPLTLTGRGRRALLERFVAHPERLPADAARRLVHAYIDAPGFEAASSAMREGVFAFAHTHVPVTLAWPERDRIVARPRRLPAWVRSVTLHGCGHVPTWDDPQQVADLLLSASAKQAGAA